MFVIRKISRQKWDSGEIQEDEIPADAVTLDLRTKDNSLSLWKCASAAEDDLGRVVLALAAAAERLDRVDVAWVDRGALAGDGIILRDSGGRTPVRSMVSEHVSAVALDSRRLGRLAQRIATAVKSERWRRFTKNEVKGILASAIREGSLHIGDLDERIQKELSQHRQAP